MSNLQDLYNIAPGRVDVIFHGTSIPFEDFQ